MPKSTNAHIVFSTDPNWKPESNVPEEAELVEKQLQLLKIRLEKKHRGGKTVTLIEGFRGPASEGEKLVKLLKNFCGTGGSAKEGELLIQGDQRAKVLQWLLKEGYSKAKSI
jgi:translation initiation factor 1